MEIRTRRISIVSGLALLSGCSLITQLKGGGGTETQESRARAATYDGPECPRVLWQLDELDSSFDYNAKETTADPSYETQILLAVCKRRSKTGTYGHEIPTWPRFTALRADASYLAQDDFRLDPIAAALTAVNVAASQSGAKSYMAPPESEVGLALLWTQIISPEQLEQALAGVQIQVPDAAKAALVTLYRAVPGALEGALTPETRYLLVDVPFAVYTERQAHYAAYRPMYERLATLRAEAAAAMSDAGRAAKVIGALEKLRSEFIASCKKAACRDLPLYANASAALAQLHVARRDVLMARTESWHNRKTYTAGFAHAVRSAQDQWVNGYEDRRRKYRQAIENGSDEKTAQNLAGGPVGDSISTDVMIDVELALPNYAAAIEENPDRQGVGWSENAYVASVGRGGRERRITFKKDRIESEEPYACRRTNRIERIQSDGTIDYETNCKYRKVTHVSESHAPIEVPAEEAEHLRAGDLLVFMSGPGGSRVLEVKRGDSVVQVRGDRVK